MKASAQEAFDIVTKLVDMLDERIEKLEAKVVELETRIEHVRDDNRARWEHLEPFNQALNAEVQELSDSVIVLEAEVKPESRPTGTHTMVPIALMSALWTLREVYDHETNPQRNTAVGVAIARVISNFNVISPPPE